VLVNNAGIGHAATILDTSLADWRRVMAVNMEGVFLGTRAAMRVMPATGGGSIVNLSSIAGLIGAPLMGAYAASKGGVRLFSKVAALECAQAGLNIRVNSVHPAFIDTPLVRAHVDHTAEPEKTRRHLERFQPIGRMGRAEDIAEGNLALASDASSFVTGSELVIDGGLTAA
jgi:NAD(P)-dependent dehydrogenase (short-subunit alcohol dehydrogenase family)